MKQKVEGKEEESPKRRPKLRWVSFINSDIRQKVVEIKWMKMDNNEMAVESNTKNRTAV